MKYIVLLGVGFLIMWTSCISEDEQSWLDRQPCLFVDVSLKNDVMPILDDYGCRSCHNSIFQNGGVNLESSDSVISAAKNGVLLNSIQHQSGAIPMPLNSSKMDVCDIDLILAWANEGYKNN